MPNDFNFNNRESYKPRNNNNFNTQKINEPSLESFMENIRPRLAPAQFQKILSIIQSYHKQTITKRSAQNQASEILGKLDPRIMSDFMNLL